MNQKFKICGGRFDYDSLKNKLGELEQEISKEGFWNEAEKAQAVLKQSKSISNQIENFEKLAQEFEDLGVLVELSDDDESIIAEVETAFKGFVKNYDELRIETLLSGEYDKNSAILSIHSGAGGTEACDWAQMLLRMYTRWGESRGYKVNTLDYLEGEEAGLKSASIEFLGEYAYGRLRSEIGVHRLVRLSPFDAAGKRHTSFASVHIMPQIDDDITIDLKRDDLKIDTYRSSGAGGQHVNTTDSAVRITHLPTGIVVSCQNERSQHKNKDTAMKMLKSKLLELKMNENNEKMNEVRGEMKEIGFSSQIRSYVFHPYSMVKDHRTNEEAGNIQSVMDGNIDAFINAFLQKRGSFE